MLRINRISLIAVICFAATVALPASIGHSRSLKESVQITLESNPEILQSIENREAIEFELQQARGLYLPKIDLEAGIGVRKLDNPSRRALGIEDDELYPSDVAINARQTLFDGFKRRSEVRRQASRVDGASFRVLERSEFIALNVTREYFQIILQQKIVNAASRNVAIHQRFVGEIAELGENGNLTDADRQQARERLLAAQVRWKESKEELANAKISYNKLVGMPSGALIVPQRMFKKLPKSLASAIGIARKNNPRVKMALADISAAESQVDAARSNYFPELSLEGSARFGEDIDGVEDRTDDFQARLVLRWNLFKGGIDVANEQEQIRRVSEARHRNHQVYREVEEAVRVSWERWQRQTELNQLYNRQLNTSKQLVSSYNEQFKIGRRSLLDLLDAQNTRFNTEVLSLVSQYAYRFAEYRLLAATGQLLASLDLSPPEQSDAYAQDWADVPELSPAELDRRLPTDQKGRLGYHQW